MQYVLSEQEYKELLTKTMHTNNDDIILTKEQAIKLLACLSRAIYKVDEYSVKNDKQVKLITDWNWELMWDLAEHYKLDMNEGIINLDTLEFEEY